MPGGHNCNGCSATWFDSTILRFMAESEPKVFYTAAECRKRLRINAHLFRQYVESRIFPIGLVQSLPPTAKGHSRKRVKRVWTHEDLQYMIYRISQQHRFRLPRPVEVPPKPPA